jgi:alkanesulfonate monooxygenase SsuD/methylene tetrahydromethanopterin reductase-like flavin-dependent oxidoreductase (luciferase family)
VEYVALGEDFHNRGARQTEQVELLRRLWSEDVVAFAGAHHTVEHAGINPRPSAPIPIWFGGSAPALLERCGRLGDGWMPLGKPDEKAAERLDVIRGHGVAAGRSMEDFAVQAQAQYAGGDPDRWRKHAERWREIGATHLAIATHRAGPTDADGHVKRVAEYLEAVREVAS